jgi:hypothetical protein
MARIFAISLPVILTISALMPDRYRLAAFLVNDYILDAEPDDRFEWQYWFIVALFYMQLVVLAIIAIPAVHRLERTYRFAVPVALMAIGLVVHYELIPDLVYELIPDFTVTYPGWLFWVFPFGWATAQAKTAWQRVVLTAVLVPVIWNSMEYIPNMATVFAFLAALIWLPWLPSTRLANRVAGAIAASTLATYLLHWQIYPVLQEHGLGHPVLVIVVCLAAGLAYFQLAERVIGFATRALRPRRRLVAAGEQAST